uniref:GDP-fucose protein O-fucosyltransferase 2 n=1 Tax=Trichobilharzia regenti TaxID=157069 RepID=A0AA85JGU9_TRIRE|nr:unnamed protein product [Trichobilharzia regenti]
MSLNYLRKMISMLTILLLIFTSMPRVYIHCKKYLFYDVFYGEGFNLRRDVYIRVANTLRLLRHPNQIPEYALHNMNIKNLTGDDWILVLPPWGPLPHWFNDRLYDKYPNYNAFNWSAIQWSKFFDLKSLSMFIPVMDLIEFQQNIVNSMTLKNLSNPSSLKIDLALQLVRETYDTIKQNSNNQRNVVDYCPNEIRELYLSDNSLLNQPMELFEGSTFSPTTLTGLLPMTATAYDCITGELEPVHLAPFLLQLIENSKKSITTLYLGSAQSIIHGHWSEWSQEYWTARRSMIFARHLRDIGDNYRAAYLHSYDTMDRTVSPLMIEQLGSGSEWLHSKWPLSPALGGPYIAVHWRRGDFISNPAPADGMWWWWYGFR